MATWLLRRRVSALILVFALFIMGMLLPTYAAGEESPSLTINGRALSQLLNRTATGNPFPLAGLLEQADGQISGVVLDQEGQPLGAHPVELNRILDVGGLRGEQDAGTTASDANGQFSFTGLTAGTYDVEVILDDEPHVTTVQLSAGSMVESSVTFSERAPGMPR